MIFGGSEDGRFHYIETGSLISIKKNVENIVIPSEEMKVQMYPMDFEEFLWALDADGVMQLIRKRFTDRVPMGQHDHLAHGQELYQRSLLTTYGYSRKFVPVEGADHTEIPDVLGTTDYLDLVAGFAEADNVLKAPVLDDSRTYGSQYEWREHVSPIVAGLLFMSVLAVTLLVLAYLRRRRAAKAFRRSCESTMEDWFRSGQGDQHYVKLGWRQWLRHYDILRTWEGIACES